MVASTSIPRARAIGGQAATARAVQVGSAEAMFAVRDAASPNVSMIQAVAGALRLAREDAKMTAVAAMTAPSMLSGRSHAVRRLSPTIWAT